MVSGPLSEPPALAFVRPRGWTPTAAIADDDPSAATAGPAAALAAAADSIGTAAAAATGAAGAPESTAGGVGGVESSACVLSEFAPAGFFDPGADEVPVSAVGLFAAVVAAIAAASAAPGSAFSARFGCIGAPVADVAEEEGSVAAAAPPAALPVSSSCAAVAASAVVEPVKLALAPFAESFSLLATAFEITALALTATVPVPVCPARPSVPCDSARKFDGGAGGTVAAAAGVELPVFAAGPLVGAGLWDAVGCGACCGDWDASADEPADAVTAGAAGICGAEAVASSKDAKGCEVGSWLGGDVCVRDGGASEAAAVTSDVILGTRELPEATATDRAACNRWAIRRFEINHLKSMVYVKAPDTQTAAFSLVPANFAVSERPLSDHGGARKRRL